MCRLSKCVKDNNREEKSHIFRIEERGASPTTTTDTNTHLNGVHVWENYVSYLFVSKVHLHSIESMCVTVCGLMERIFSHTLTPTRILLRIVCYNRIFSAFPMYTYVDNVYMYGTFINKIDAHT